MIAALALGARVLDQPEYERAARKAVDFILSNMRDNNGVLFHRFRDGQRAVHAHAADYAFLTHGLLSLYQATFDPALAEEAATLQAKMRKDFWDDENGGFFATAKNRTDLPVRPKELYDGAMPSANSVAFFNLVLLSRMTGEARWQKLAAAQQRAFAGTLKSQPPAYTYFLCALDMVLEPDPQRSLNDDKTDAGKRVHQNDA